jgi:hypothetical protein
MTIGLQDAVHVDGVDASTIGCWIVLPSSFVGGPRHMNQLYQNAVAIVRSLGTPDYFITFTCNGKWPEITNELLRGQTAFDRSDLTARVFNIKLNNLMDDLLKKQVFGEVHGCIHVIEFQKRGLPHAHILLILAPDDKPKTPEYFDRFISAELPNKVTHPLAYKTATAFIVHGPCGERKSKAPCMENDRCTKHYPKEYREVTNSSENGYPIIGAVRTGTPTLVPMVIKWLLAISGATGKNHTL